MRTEEFWVLDEDDRESIARLTPGVGEDAARVLAYLLLRSAVEDGPATELTIRIGTGLNRSAITSALERLESTRAVDRTTVRNDGPGRPPAAWRPARGHEAAARATYRHQAGRLIERAREVDGTEVDDGPGPAGGTEANGTATLALGLNWRANALHLPFYAAACAGEYEREGVAVGINHHEGSHRALAAVRSGGADVGLVGAATVLRARAAGDPVVPIAVAYQRAMAVLYTVRDRFGEPLTGVEQLRDRRIGMPARSETRVLGRLFLNQVALEGAVRIVDTAGEERDALLSGEVDVVTGSAADPRELEREGLTVDSLAVADHFPIYGPTLVVRTETLARREATLEAFLTATIAGWTEARRDPTLAAERIADLAGEPPERVAETYERALTDFAGGEAVDANGWGWQREETWDRLRTALEQGGLLTETGAA